MNNEIIEIDKYYNSILYFVSYCKNKHFGSIKLNNLLYYLDFIFYRDNKKTITGDVYRKLDFGPVGKQVQDILQKLQDKDYLKIDNSRYTGNYDTIKFIAKRKVDMNVFDKEEQELLKRVNYTFLYYSTSRIINQSQSEAPFLYTKMYYDIEYKLSEDIDII